MLFHFGYDDVLKQSVEQCSFRLEGLGLLKVIQGSELLLREADSREKLSLAWAFCFSLVFFPRIFSEVN